MSEKITKIRTEYQAANRRRRVWRRVASILALAGVFCTTWAMILPAITLDNPPICETNHEHDARCYIQNADDSALNEWIEVRMPPTFTYENDSFTMSVHVEGEAMIEKTIADNETGAESDSESKAETTVACEPIMNVTFLDESNTEYAALYDRATANMEPDALLDFRAIRIGFSLDGQPINTENCTITPEILPKLQPIFSDSTQFSYAAPEAEIGTVFTLLQNEATESLFVADGRAADEPLTIRLTSDTFALTTARTANPRFTVQYYANIDKVSFGEQHTDGQTLDIIDTTGKNLPENGANPLKYLEIENTSGFYTIKSVDQLERVYSDQVYDYITAPNLSYFNRLYRNANYRLEEIWILKDGKSAESNDRADWDIYDYTADLHFTNRVESAGGNTLLIENNAVIRLVYDSTTADYSNDVNFYDYDITNGKLYSTADGAKNQNESLRVTNPTPSGTYYAKTDSADGSNPQGINANSNYQASGSRLAFGNENTRVKLGYATWNGNSLNAYNKNNESTKDCTFGLVSGLSKDHRLIFSEGVNAPNLFGEGDAAGKTPIGGYALVFDRHGDTYTLSSVKNESGKAVLQNLSQMVKYTNKEIYSNEFWPLDQVYNYTNNYIYAHDKRFGAESTKDSFHAVGYEKDKNGGEYYSDITR